MRRPQAFGTLTVRVERGEDLMGANPLALGLVGFVG